MDSYLTDAQRVLVARALVKFIAATDITDAEFRPALEALAMISGTDMRVKVECSRQEKGNAGASP